MNKISQVLEFLIPTGGWVTSGDDFSGVQFLECEPITEKQFNDGVKLFETKQRADAEAKEQSKASLIAKLAALGLTADEIASL
jgi:hypothetical protein